jgi:hypothetical protein
VRQERKSQIGAPVKLPDGDPLPSIHSIILSYNLTQIAVKAVSDATFVGVADNIHFLPSSRPPVTT